MIHKVLDVTQFTQSAYRLRCEKKNLNFLAGQCANVGLPSASQLVKPRVRDNSKPDVGINREYSLYSGEQEPYLDFLIKEVQGGLVSVALKDMAPGDDVEIHGAYGDFRLRSDDVRAKSFLFIATGTGIAPFHCFVKTYPGLDYKILHGVRQADEGYDAKDYDPTRYVLCASRDKGGNFSGRVTDYLKANPNLTRNGILAYLCGNRAMISEAYDVLRSQNVSGDQIFTEVFF